MSTFYIRRYILYKLIIPKLFYKFVNLWEKSAFLSSIVYSSTEDLTLNLIQDHFFRREDEYFTVSKLPHPK